LLSYSIDTRFFGFFKIYIAGAELFAVEKNRLETGGLNADG